MPREEATRPLPLPPTPLLDGRPHVYVVNSDPGFLEIIADLLSDTRVRVTLEQLRPNPSITAENIRSAQPDLLMLDVVPFQKDAELLLEEMQDDIDLAHLPVLLASTSSRSMDSIANQYAEQVCDVLPKPFDLDDFYAKIERLLPSSSAHGLDTGDE